MNGIQFGIINDISNVIDSGSQIRLYNQAGQAGISFAIQFGALNIAWENPIPIMPVVNFNFWKGSI